MGHDKFGSVVHDILRRFGEDLSVRDSADAKVISAFLDDCLDQKIRRDQATYASRIAYLQLEQARQRLHDFARWQAQWRERGNKILWVEVSVPHSDPCLIDVDGTNVKISGQIDRIDYCRQTGELFVFDYKTYDSLKKDSQKDSSEESLLDRSEKNEIAYRYWRVLPYPPYKDGTIAPEPLSNGKWRHWTDLQLVLYRPLARKILQRENFAHPVNKITSSYIILPKNRLCKAYAADWSRADLEDARRTFEWAIQTIRLHWRLGVDPAALIDPLNPERGTMLDHKVGKIHADLAPITGIF